MKWIVGLSEEEAKALDAEMLNNARLKLGTIAQIWGAFKHPDTTEWCVPYDEERAILADLVTNPKQLLDSKAAQVKTIDDIRRDNWIKEGSILVGLQT